MHTVLWTFFVMFWNYTCCYENISRRPTTIISQSSTFQNYNASKANDGDLNTTSIYCSHTDVGRTRAWLQVDLARSYSINSVTIYYRRDGDGSSHLKQFRFRQFYLDVSNSSVTEGSTTQRTRCYTDNTTYPVLPPHIIHIPCKHTARYVIVETTYDAPEDDPITGAILEICEIEVYGCNKNCKDQLCNDIGYCSEGCVDEYWGPACNSPCPGNCKELTCNRSTGYCISCRTGYLENTCTLNCSLFCSGKECDQTNGKCTQGCTLGRYGDTCHRTCSPGCAGGTCDQESGTCLNGCEQNWTGVQCDVCDSTHYGTACSLECSGNCLNNTCNNDTGSCTYECQEGFYGEKCEKDCSCPTGCDRITARCSGNCSVGIFGEYCNKTCSEYCENGCNKNTGSCTEGCVLGRFGDFCNETCDARCASCCEQKTENMKPLKESSSENVPILIGVCVALCISLLVNGCTITRILRHNECTCKRQEVSRHKTKSDSQTMFSVTQQGIYDTAEDNAGYQELGQISGPSHYDQLHGTN